MNPVDKEWRDVEIVENCWKHIEGGAQQKVLQRICLVIPDIGGGCGEEASSDPHLMGVVVVQLWSNQFFQAFLGYWSECDQSVVLGY